MMAKTHAKDWALERDMGWITRCGLFVDVPTRISDDPTCARCRCWLGLCDCVDICQGPYGEGAHIDGRACDAG